MKLEELRKISKYLWKGWCELRKRGFSSLIKKKFIRISELLASRIQKILRKYKEELNMLLRKMNN